MIIGNGICGAGRVGSNHRAGIGTDPEITMPMHG